MKKILLSLTLFTLLTAFTPGLLAAERQLIDDFNGTSNVLGGRSNVYQRAPSRVMARRVTLERTEIEINKKKNKIAMLKYDKKAAAGPYNKGGWCGYYTLLGIDNEYFDASNYEKLTVWVRGYSGTENFVIGLADSYWQQAGDSLKSEEIGKYLPGGKLTTYWQKAEIPLDVYFLDLKELVSIAICFEGELFGGNEAKGTIYIDDIAFE